MNVMEGLKSTEELRIYANICSWMDLLHS